MGGICKKILGMGIMLSLLISLTGCQEKTSSYSHTDFAMGTVTNVTLYGTGNDLEQTEEKIIKKVKEIEEKQISWRIEDSQIARLNKTLAQKDQAVIKEPLKGWLMDALELSRDSMADGRNAVDPSIGKLTQLWDFESENPKVPDADKIRDTVKGTLPESSEHITIRKKNGEILTCETGTKFDLGAFGKGIGTDEATKLLKKEENISGAMVALGGSILVYGEKPDGSDWNVGVQSPSGKDGEVLGSLKVKGDTFISTSGDYEKYFVDKKTGKKYFHILDSKTGYPVETDITSCTIICDSGINSDGLSTACFTLGVEKSRELLKKYNAKAIFVDKKKNVYVSEGLDFTLQDDDYKISE